MESCAKHAGKMWKERFEEDYPYITYFRPTPDSGKLSVNPCRGEIYGVYPKTCENCTHCWEAVISAEDDTYYSLNLHNKKVKIKGNVYYDWGVIKGINEDGRLLVNIHAYKYGTWGYYDLDQLIVEDDYDD